MRLPRRILTMSSAAEYDDAIWVFSRCQWLIASKDDVEHQDYHSGNEPGDDQCLVPLKDPNATHDCDHRYCEDGPRSQV